MQDLTKEEMGVLTQAVAIMQRMLDDSLMGRDPTVVSRFAKARDLLEKAIDMPALNKVRWHVQAQQDGQKLFDKEMLKQLTEAYRNREQELTNAELPRKPVQPKPVQPEPVHAAPDGGPEASDEFFDYGGGGDEEPAADEERPAYD